MALDLSESRIKAATPPPRKSAPTARQTKATPAQVQSYVSPKQKDREEGANGLFQLAGFGLIVTKNYADAGAIGKHSPKISHELAVLADKNEGVAKFLDYLTEAGPYAGLITACMPLILQIMANHNMIKAEALAGSGVVAPAALEAGVKADMARQTAEALREQREAEEELKMYATPTPESEAPNGESKTGWFQKSEA
jgi:hypothetical protein